MCFKPLRWRIEALRVKSNLDCVRNLGCAQVLDISLYLNEKDLEVILHPHRPCRSHVSL